MLYCGYILSGEAQVKVGMVYSHGVSAFFQGDFRPAKGITISPSFTVGSENKASIDIRGTIAYKGWFFSIAGGASTGDNGKTYRLLTNVGRSADMEYFALNLIEGRVFIDVNNNGVFDEGDEACEGIPVLLDGAERVHTDGLGRYMFLAVKPGEHTVEVDLANLPADLGGKVGEQRRLEIGALQRTRVDFPLVSLGRIEGRVFIDRNRNGVCDAGEQGIPNVVVELKGKNRVTLTDGRGRYVFYNVPPGMYLVDLRVMPQGMEVSIQGLKMYVYLKPGRVSKDNDFPLARKQKRVRKKVFGD